MRRRRVESVAEEAVLAEEFKSGFSWKSLLAVLYSLSVFTPAAIWLDLVTLGVGLGSTVSFCTLLLFSEFARMSGSSLTKQEAVMIFGPATIAGSGGFLNLIYRMWFVKQPLLHVFNIDPMNIPRWWAPPPTSPAFELRTFLYPEVALPLVLSLITWFTGLTGALFFSLFLRELYIEGERLPFPIQNITVGAIESLTEREETRLTVLAWTLVIGFIYAAILYTIPTYSRAAGYSISMIPVPWLDLTRYFEDALPGIAFGIATDMMIFTQGFVLPTNIVIGMLIGSIARFVIINPLLVSRGISPWAEKWTPGMGVTQILQQSNLYFWLSPIIGVGFAVGIVPAMWRIRNFARSLKLVLAKKPDAVKNRISGPPSSLFTLLLLYAVGCAGSLLLDIYLVPDFPFWLLAIYELALPFIIGLMNGRMVGVTGQAVSIPHLNNLVILGGVAQGYNKIDAWFLPLQLNPGTGWLRTMKICQLTRTTVSSWVKMTLIAHPLALLIGFIYVSLFWQIAPIPSSVYPTPQIMWPIQAQNKMAWITATRGSEFFDVKAIACSFIIFGGFISVTRFLRVPFHMTSVAVGLGMPIPIIMTQLLGLIAGRILARVSSEDFFKKYKITMAAGVALGEGLAIVIGVISALVIKSIWARPL